MESAICASCMREVVAYTTRVPLSSSITLATTLVVQARGLRRATSSIVSRWSTISFVVSRGNLPAPLSRYACEYFR